MQFEQNSTEQSRKVFNSSAVAFPTSSVKLNVGCCFPSQEKNNAINGEYEKSSILVTNNMIESISLKDANYCLNENKNDEYKKICKKKNMHTITPTMIEPEIKELKENLVKGTIISFDVNNINISNLNLIVKTITSRGYEIKGLSKVVSEQ